MQTNKKIILAKILSFILLKIFKFKVTQIVNRKGINYKLNLRQGIDLSIFIFGSFQNKINTILHIIRVVSSQIPLVHLDANIHNLHPGVDA